MNDGLPQQETPEEKKARQDRVRDVKKLIPVKKGDPSPNKGHFGPQIRTFMRHALETRLPADIARKIEAKGMKLNEKTYKGAIVAAMIGKAMRGDTRAADFVFDRVYGKVQQNIEMKTTNAEHTMIFEVIEDEPPQEIIEAEIVSETNETESTGIS